MAKPKVTPARRKALAELEKQWRKAKQKNRRALQKGVELPFDYANTNLREIKKLPTNKLKSVTRNLTTFNNPRNSATRVVKANDQLYVTKETLQRLTKVETQLKILERKEIDRQKATPYFLNNQPVSTVYKQNAMRKKDTVFSRFLPAYDIKNARKESDVKHAISVREKRLNPNWSKEKAQQMKTNYIQNLENRFNSLADDVIASLKTLSDDQFFEIYERFDEIEFVYETDTMISVFDDHDILDEIREIIRDYK